MNRRGFGWPSIGLVFVLVLVVVVLAARQGGVDTSTINSTIENLNWSKFNGNISNSITISEANQPTYIVTILEICKKAIDFFGYSIFAVAKLAMQIAKDNPNIVNYKVLLFFVLLSLVAPIIYPSFIVIVSLFLIIKEAIITHRERKELRTLERKYG